MHTTNPASEHAAPDPPASVRPATALTPLARRLLVGGGWSLAGRLGVALTGLVTSALLARLLNPTEFGVYLVALSVVAVGALLGGLGLNQVAVRFIAESVGAGTQTRAWSAVRTAGWLTAAGGATFATAYLVVGAPVAELVFRAPALHSLGLVLAGWILVLTGQYFVTEAHRGYGDIRAAALYGGLLQAGLLLCVLAIATVADLPFTITTVSVVTVGCAAAGTLVGLVTLRRRHESPHSALARSGGDDTVSASDLLRVASPLLVTSALVVAFAQADLWVVAALLPEAEVAAYGAAGRAAVVVGLPLIVVNGVVAPLIADLYARDRRAELQSALRTTATVASVPAAALAAVFVVAGGPLLNLVYGDHYASGATVLALLALGQLTCVVTGSCGVALAMTGRQGHLVAVTAVSVALTVTALVILTRAYGTTGAAAAAATGYAVQNLLLLVAARRATGLWTSARLSDLPALAGHAAAAWRVLRARGGQDR